MDGKLYVAVLRGSNPRLARTLLVSDDQPMVRAVLDTISRRVGYGDGAEETFEGPRLVADDRWPVQWRKGEDAEAGDE